MTASPKPTDEFDAVRIVVEVLKDLQPQEQARVMRWAQEKLGIGPPTLLQQAQSGGGQLPQSGASDIRTFVLNKNPRNDVHFATTVAYYFAFEAPEAARKAEIGTKDLQDAARQASRTRLKNPAQTLSNSVLRGYLDRGSGRGLFRINTVGENLVAMSLPLADKSSPAGRKK